jgi:homoserine kinase type II
MGEFTEFDSAAVRAIAGEYGLRAAALTLLRGGVENTNIRVSAAEGTFVLTILEKKDAGEAAAYAGYLRDLADAGLPVPAVRSRVAGGYVARYCGRPVIVSGYVDGRSSDRLPARLLGRAGAALARVHAARDVDCRLPPYLRLSPGSINEAAAFPDAQFADWLVSRHERVRHVVESGGAQVPTHGDLFPDNIIVRASGELVFVDWDDGSADYPWIDVGMAILGLCCTPEFVPGRGELLLAGYHSEAAARLDLAMVRDAFVYVALFTAYNRYRRRGTTRSNRDPQRAYDVIPRVVASLERQWTG